MASGMAPPRTAALCAIAGVCSRVCGSTAGAAAAEMGQLGFSRLLYHTCIACRSSCLRQKDVRVQLCLDVCLAY